MAKIQDIDIRLMIQRLRPGSEYHWSGSGDLGNDMTAIVEWRDPDTALPEEAEVVAEWDAYQAEQVTVEAKRQATKADLDGVKPGAVQAALESIETDLVALAAANLNETKQIIGRILVRQRGVIKAVRHLV